MNKYEEALLIIKNKVETAKFIEDTRASLLRRKQELDNDIENLTSCKLHIISLQEKMDRVSIAYKEERQEFLQQISNEFLKRLFPDDYFCVKFVPTVYRGVEYVDLYSGHDEKGLSPLEMQHGRLYRQFLGYVITTVIQKSRGCDLLIMDETLNSGDEDTLMGTSRIVKDLLEEGRQLIMIEHKHVLYENLPRVQYNLRRDASENKVEIVQKKEYS